MWARHVQLKSIHADILTTLHNFHPSRLVVFFHNRCDQHTIWKAILKLFKFIDPDVETAVANQLDVFPAVDFLRLSAAQPPVPGLYVDDLIGIQAHCLTNDSSPAFVKSLTDNVRVCTRRPRSDHERIRKSQSVYSGTKTCHDRNFTD